MTLCSCSSKKEFDQCCGPYLTGDAVPPTAETLMRSRFSAYARQEYPYLVKTHHEDSRPTLEDFGDQKGISWTELEIIDTEAGGPDDADGIVEFKAHYERAGATGSLHERSSFAKEDGQWFYVDGEIIQSPPVRSTKIGRNEPCPCGSGKKYKKCCLGK